MNIETRAAIIMAAVWRAEECFFHPCGKSSLFEQLRFMRASFWHERDPRWPRDAYPIFRDAWAKHYVHLEVEKWVAS